ncbi:Ig-like domain-containing protein [Paenibacillus sp. 32352]|uniref:Ig-like domain-containing protein n=1 Tax=Paenibacillus sp. 32352 TaxID=1969111 RepID=UPI0009AEDCB1|nr:Ig-like domain-containing protein [Paenibacillus sp. 32352]
MNSKYIACAVSLFLLSTSVLPLAYAENEASEVTSDEVKTDEVKADESKSEELKADEVKKEEATANEAKAVKTSDDYEDLKMMPQDLKDKFDLFIKNGILKPESENTFGFNLPVTRDDFVQASKVIFSGSDNEALTIDYLESFRALGLINEEGMAVDPNVFVSRQDLAKFLIYGLGKVDEARNVKPITDDSIRNEDRVDKAASRFVTLALQLKIMQNLDDNRFHGTDRTATRKTLVESAFETRKLLTNPSEKSKVSIVEAKAVGARKVSVTFEDAVDAVNAAKAILTVKIGGNAIPGSTVWSADKKSATVTLETKLTKGNYTVELSGLEDAAVAKKTADFSAEDETIKKIEFVNTSDQLARSKVIVEFKQINQYGEQTSLPAASFDIRVSSGINMQYLPGRQSIKLDLSKERRGSGVFISIFDAKNNLNVSNNFIIGDRAMISKIEMGKLTYKDNKQLQPGGKVYLSFRAYDQYGCLIDDVEELDRGIVTRFEGESLFENVKDKVFVDYDNDNYPELELLARNDFNQDKGTTLHLMAVGSGQTAKQEIAVFAPKLAASVKIADLTTQIAEGDSDVGITLEIRDAEGYSFNTDEIAALYKAGQIQVRSTGVLKLGSIADGEPIGLSGANKGKVVVQPTKSGSASIEVFLKDANQKATAEYTVQSPRVPERLEKSGFEPSEKITVIQGVKGTIKTIKYIIKDQYDTEFKTAPDEYQVEYRLEKVSGDSGAFTGNFGGNSKLQLNDANPTIRVKASQVNSTDNGVIQLTADSKKLGVYKVVTTLVKARKDPKEADPTKWPIQTELQTISAQVQSYTLKEIDEDLTYFLSSNTSMFAIGKFLVDRDLIGNKISSNSKKEKKATQEDGAYIFKNKPEFLNKTEITVGAKDKQGNEVTFPPGAAPVISSVQFVNPNLFALDKPSFPTKMIGLNPGSTDAVVTVNTPVGSKAVKVNFNAFASELEFNQLKVTRGDNSVTNVDPKAIDGRYIWDATLLAQVQVLDSNNNAFTNKSDKDKGTGQDQITPFMGVFGVSFALTDITYKPGTKEEDKDTFYMTDDYKLVFVPKSGIYETNKVNLQSFKLVLMGPNNTPKNFTFNVK